MTELFSKGPRYLLSGQRMSALLLASLPAGAEVVVHERDNGIVVSHDRGHHYGWRNHRAECQTVSAHGCRTAT